MTFQWFHEFLFQDIPVQSAIVLPIFFFDGLLSFLQMNSKTLTRNFKKDKHSCPPLPALLREALSILCSWDVAGICRKHWDFWMSLQSYCFHFCVIYCGSDKLWQMNNAHQCLPIHLDLRLGLPNHMWHYEQTIIILGCCSENSL